MAEAPIASSGSPGPRGAAFTDAIQYPGQLQGVCRLGGSNVWVETGLGLGSSMGLCEQEPVTSPPESQ